MEGKKYFAQINFHIFAGSWSITESLFPWSPTKENFCFYTYVSKKSQGCVKNIIMKEVGKVCWQQKIPADPCRNNVTRKKTASTSRMTPRCQWPWLHNFVWKNFRNLFWKTCLIYNNIFLISHSKQYFTKKQEALNYSCKKLHLRSSAGFWIRLRVFRISSKREDSGGSVDRFMHFTLRKTAIEQYWVIQHLLKMHSWSYQGLQNPSQPAFTCSKLTIETQQGVKYVQS